MHNVCISLCSARDKILLLVVSNKNILSHRCQVPDVGWNDTFLLTQPIKGRQYIVINEVDFQGFYASHGVMTDPGEYTNLLDGLPIECN